jgi:hypothetical protein
LLPSLNKLLSELSLIFYITEILVKTAAPVKGKPQNGSRTRTAEQLFDSDSDVREPSLADSDELKSPKDGSEDDSMSEDDLRDSEDDLQALKGDSTKLKEVLDFEVCY